MVTSLLHFEQCQHAAADSHQYAAVCTGNKCGCGYVCTAGETCVTGEHLPSISRTTNFRVTVRDNKTDGGGVRDGSTSVVVNAAAPTATARIKIEAVGNIYLDINKVNFAITAPTAATVIAGGQILTQTGRRTSGIQVSLTDSEGNTRTTISGTSGYYRFDDVRAGKTMLFRQLANALHLAGHCKF